MGQRLRRTEDQKSRPALAVTQDSMKGEGLNQKLKSENAYIVRGMWAKLLFLKRIADGVRGQSSQPLGNFLQFFEKKSYFKAIKSLFACVPSHLKELIF